MRISGLSSGMDTEQLINDIMAAQRIPVDRVFQQKVRAEWKRDAYRDVNTKLSRLKNLTFDMSLQSTYQKNIATSSHSNLISVTASGKAEPGHLQLQVKQLAETAQLVSNGAGERIANFDWEEIEGETSFQLKGLDGEWETIEFGDGETLEALAAKINKNKNLGITAFAHNGNISLVTKDTGSSAVIEVQGDTDGFFAHVFETDAAVVAQGIDAVINVNGIDVEQSSNNFELNGLTFNLHEVSEQKVQVEVKSDVDGVFDKIKEFVDLYNELIDEFNGSIREEFHRDFPPLTDEQRAALSDKEIELYEEKAKSGILRSDPILGNILSEMRMALGATVQGLEGNKSLAQIGIKTGGWFEHGRLHIDENKLKAAIEEDAEGVMDIFTKRSDVVSEQGLTRRLTTAVDKGIERINQTAGKATSSYDQYFLGKQIRDYEDRLDIMEERLIRFEQQQWNKFTAMEKVLSQLYAQSDWLFQQLAGLQG